MNIVGGYFELELQKGGEYHKNALRLNSGRNALEYILRAREYRKVYLPFYTCNVMLEPVNKLSLEFEFYHIDGHLNPVFNFSRIKEDETFIYINYFGIKSHAVERLANVCPDNLIIDNSQAFFEKPLSGIDTFYSPRKFFGLPDGAYLFTEVKLDIEFEKDNSLSRFGHLLGRIENGVEESYSLFIENDKSLTGQPIKLMSNITSKLLKSIDYESVARIRKNNFRYLHNALNSLNVLKPDYEDCFTPLSYPFLSDKEGLRKYLIQNKIFVAQYWPNVLEWCEDGSIEKKFALNLLSLPTDQRYSENEMRKITDLILKYA